MFNIGTFTNPCYGLILGFYMGKRGIYGFVNEDDLGILQVKTEDWTGENED